MNDPVGKYESVCMVATGFGMAVLLPYLKQLIHGYQSRKVCTRQIRAIWQINRIDKHGREWGAIESLGMQRLLSHCSRF